MPNSLSVLLPVKNAQATLAATVQEILDVAADLSDKFELLIIDDGSSDATSEIATELTRNYPQVRIVRQGRSIGRQEAIRSGLKQTRGDVVLLHEERGGSPMEEIVWLWRATSPKGRIFLPPQMGHGKHKSGTSDPQHSTMRRGFRMLDRHGVEKSGIHSGPIMPNFLAHLKDFALSE
ncbi:MAG: glycosyltransferase [Pirellulales bacterium]|nr:glycosyltransferase [Pirellulales bacterium]